MIEVKEVIVTDILTRGDGKKSPIRPVIQVFEKDGTLIAENDPHDETFSLFDLIHFARWAESKGYKAETLNPEHVTDWLISIGKK